MITNYLKIAWRSLKGNKIYSFINIFGLAVGMACCIVIMLFVQDELSFDRFNKNSHRIYRITMKRTLQGGQEFHSSVSYGVMGPNLVNDFPEVVSAVRIIMYRWFVIEYGDKRLTTDPVFADPSILDIFTFPLIRGDKNTALKDPTSVVISQDLAEKLFGDEDPMGKVITNYSIDSKYDLIVTGILKNIPYNSHFRFDFLTSIEHLKSRSEEKDSRLTGHTYLLLDNNADPRKLEEKLPDFALKYLGERASTWSYFLQPLTSIHLHSDLQLELRKNSNITTSYSLSAVAFLILLIACINYMNLSTARASRRSREVGLRRVVGASRFQLFRQFLGESILFSLIALLIAVVMGTFLLRFFNPLINKHLSMNFKENLFLYVGLILLSLVVGFLSGSYPALFLSSIRPSEALKGDVKKGTLLGIFMRKGLVVFQFAVSLVFIIGTIIIFLQLNFVRNKDLGFEKDNIIEIPIFKDEALTQRSELVKRELSQHPNVKEVIATTGYPGGYAGWAEQCIPEGYSEDNPVKMNVLSTGEDFFDFFRIDIVEGRDFSREITTDADSAVIINETAVKKLGWEFPVGKQIKSEEFVSKSNKTGLVTVIGVVKDFHNGPLYEEIKPSIYTFGPEEHSTVYMRVRPENVQETIAFLEKKWRDLPTHLIFFYRFIDDSLENFLYRKDREVGKVFKFSSILAIVLACLGLFGLASFTAERRIKEIGIRKVLGASVPNIVLLLSKDFSRLVLIANLIGWPIGYYVMHRWLENFAYRIGIGWWVLMLAAVVVFVITLLTISYQSLKAAHTDPAVTLRYE
jgi:putative ABC transport system permease protein